jgi:hypothetical protein
MIDVSTIQQSALMMIVAPIITLYVGFVAMSVIRYILSK